MISDIKYDIILALEKDSSSFFGQATITFKIPQNLPKKDYEHIFLNFTNGGCQWISEDIVLNNMCIIDTTKVFYNNRINLIDVYDEIEESSKILVPVDGKIEITL